MRIKTKAALLAFALAGALITPAAQAAGSSSPLANDSSLRTFVCDTGTAANDYGIVKLNDVTLEATQIGASRSYCGGGTNATNFSVNSTAYNPQDGTVYASVTDGSNKFMAAFKLDGSVIDLDSSTAKYYNTYTLSGSAYNTQVSIAINPMTGNAYAAENNKFYSLNISTRALTLIASSIGANLTRMGFTPNGTLYGWDSANDRFVSVDPATGIPTTVASNWISDYRPVANGGYNLNFNQIVGFSFDSAGTLFISIGGQNAYEIWSASASDNFATLTRLNGSNPNASPGNIDSWNVWSTAVQQISGNPLVITYGLQKINFNANSGTVKPTYSRFYSPTFLSAAGLSGNTPITLPTPTRTGYTFNGWFDAATGGTKIGVAGDSYTPTGAADINMYAQWTEIGKAATLPKTGSNENQLALAAFMILAGLVSLGLGRKTAK